MEEYQTQLEKDKMRSTDRVLIVRPVEEGKVKSSTGLLDNRIFKVDGTLKAVKDEQYMWRIKYNNGGILPEPLRQTWTSFRELKKFVDGYFLRRGLKIVEVRD